MVKAVIEKLFRNQNNRQVSGNVLWTVLIKGCAMLISILTVPSYVRYFGDNADGSTVYGAWLTISAVFTWINMFDFGIGNGLRNHLVKSIADKNSDTSKRLVSSAYVSVGIISLLFLVVGLAASAFVNWNTAFKVPETLISAVVFRTFIQTVFVGVVLHFFFLLVSSIFYALQKTFWPSMLMLISHSLILLYIVFPNGGTLEAKLTELSYVYVLAYNLPILTATLILFLGKYKEMRPSVRKFDKDCAKKILSLGGIFFVIQISLIALNSSNELYINTFFNPADVTQYNYYNKLFYIIVVFISLLGQPIWSAITKAYCEKRYGWIKSAWKILTVIQGLCVLACVVLAFLYQPLADIWLGKGKLTVEALPLILFTLNTIQMVMINTSATVANGLGLPKVQAVLTAFGAVAKLPLVWLLSKWLGTWYAVVAATLIASLPLMIVMPVRISRFIGRLKETTQKEKLS